MKYIILFIVTVIGTQWYNSIKYEVPNTYLEGYIGVYTPYDIIWIDPYGLSITTENDTVNFYFEDINSLSDWVEEITATHLMIAEQLPKDFYVDWVYSEDNIPYTMNVRWYDSLGASCIRYVLIPDSTKYPNYRVVDLIYYND